MEADHRVPQTLQVAGPPTTSEHWKNSSSAGAERSRRSAHDQRRERQRREGEERPGNERTTEGRLEKDSRTQHGRDFYGDSRTFDHDDKKIPTSGSSSRAVDAPVQAIDDKSRPPKPKAVHRARAPNFNPGLTAPDSRSSSTPDESAAHDTGDKSRQSRPPRPKAAHRARVPNFNQGSTIPDSKGSPEPNSSSQSTGSKQREHPSDKQRPKPRPASQQVLADDLTSRLIHSLATRPYPDCPICFSAVHPNQPTWSCSPSIPQALSPSEDGNMSHPQYCWTTFHLKCIRNWAEKSVKTIEEAWRNRGEMDRKGEWRCPGCQAKREMVPTSYWCFCHFTPDPKPPRLATPHSCGNSCARPRASGCGHPCPLLCHPGPCPPCRVVMQVPCPCPGQKIVMFRCGDDAIPGNGKAREGTAVRDRTVSCGNVCGRTLDCGKHSCQRLCHPGACGGCKLIEEVKCYCGRTSKQLGCGEGEATLCSILDQKGDEVKSWIGRFECEQTCDRPFNCGVHRCQRICHALSSEPAPCPFSPSKITHCPCGNYAILLSDDSPASLDGEFVFLPRQGCTDPIPTCDSTCSKIHPLCGHECTGKCHLGPCPPCSVPTIRPCRCGFTTREIKCSEYITKESGEIDLFCDRPCTALRACGKHECRRLCCPLASLALGKAKRGRGAGVDTLHTTGMGEEEGGLHECDLLCGRPLACGNHTCERKDHKGPCPTCLRSTFEEVICPCGRTILEPPIACGTKINCRYQCPHQPSCGHPPMSHTCHEESLPCPLCAYLATKLCACGKKEMVNTRCSLEREKVSCAAVCERLLSCGYHQCQRLCHGGDCEACTAPCGKDRKLCLPAHHPCTSPCHAPSTCPEDEPCEALVALSCPCGRLRQSIRCGHSNLSPHSSESASSRSPKCNSQCEIAKRNARLAEALGINDETRERSSRNMAGGPVIYPDEVIAFAKEDPKFALLVEKTLAEFIASNKRSQVLPHMPQEKRKFVHGLVGIYRLDAQMVDQEPVRSVQIVRRLDSRVPTPLLSTYVTSVAPPPNFGKLSLSPSVNPNSAWRLPSSKPGSPAPTPAPTPASATGKVIPPVPGLTASGARGWGSGFTGNPRVVSTTTTAAAAATPPSSSASGLSGRTPPHVGSSVENVRGGVKSTTTTTTTTTTTVGNVVDENVPDNWEDDV